MHSAEVGAHECGIVTLWLKGTVVTLFWIEHQKPTPLLYAGSGSEGIRSGMAVTSMWGRD